MPARHRHRDPRVGELCHERVEPFSRQVRLRQTRRRATEDLVLLLEEPVPLLQLTDLGGLGPGLAGRGALVDVGATQLLLQRHRVNTEVIRDLFHRHSGLTVPCDAHDVITELARVGLGHSNILQAHPSGKPHQMSPTHAADPCALTAIARHARPLQPAASAAEGERVVAELAGWGAVQRSRKSPSQVRTAVKQS